MTPPDSDAVCGAMVARVNGDPLLCEMARGHDGAHEAKLAGPLSAHGRVMLPLPLAQRILAALEREAETSFHKRKLSAVIAELRAVIGK